MRKRLLVLVALAGCTGAAPEGVDSQRSPLEVGFAEVASESGVPESLLKAIAWVEGRFRHHPESGGLTGLGESGRVRSLERAARLTGIDRERLLADPRANLRGGATILRELADGQLGVASGSGTHPLGAWYPVAVRFADFDDPRLSEAWADEVFAAMERGAARELDDGWVVLAPAPINAFARSVIGAAESAPEPDFPGAIWSASPNFTPGRSGTTVDRIIVHTTGRNHAAALALYKDAGSKESPHYLVRSSDGQITQLVEEKDTALHAACFDGRSIGIAHEAVDGDPAWFTDEMLTASAKLARSIADRHGIPLDRQHVIGHSEVSGDCSGPGGEPGNDWNWTRYLLLANEQCSLVGLIHEVGDSSKRIAGATVKVVGTSHSMVTDEIGKYTFMLPPGTYTVEASKAGYETRSVQRTAALGDEIWGSIPLPRVETPTAGTLAGSVYEKNPANPSDTSRPVQGAQVKLSNGMTATSAADGSFSFEVPAGSHSVTVSKDGYASATATKAVATGETATVAIGLGALGFYKGTVFDGVPQDMSRPIAGARVELTKAGSLVEAMTTGSDGKFSFEVEIGEYTATASKAGYTSASSTRTVPKGDIAWGSIWLAVSASQDTTPPLVLIESPEDGASFDARQVDVIGMASDDSGIVTGLSWTLNGGSATTQTMQDGSFSFQVQLAPGQNRIVVTATDRAGNSGSSEVTVSFRSGVSGWVHREGDEAARIAGVEVKLEQVDGTLVKEVTTGIDGSFALDVAPGTYRLHAELAGFVPFEQQMVVPDDARLLVRIALAEQSQAPEIKITAPADGAVVTSQQVEVQGYARNFVVAHIEVNGIEATRLSGDSFSAAVSLVEGSNTITATATGEDGERVEDSIEVRYEPASAPDAGVAAPDAGGEEVPPPTAPVATPAPGCGCSTGTDPVSLVFGALVLGMVRRRRG